MSGESERLDGIVEIQDRKFYYTLFKENNKTFVKVADIIFERNKNHNLLTDINNKLEEKGLIEQSSPVHDSI